MSKDKDDIEAVEARTGHILSKTHLISIEGSKPKRGKKWDRSDDWTGYPIFAQAREDGSGEHINYGKLNGEFYLAKLTFSEAREPVEFFKSGRNSDR